MHAEFRKLFRKGPPSNAAVNHFIAEHKFPLVAGKDVTFVFRGQADAVFLRCWISGLDTAQPFQELPDTDL